MDLSIVIPAFNEEKLLGRCLTAVADAAEALTRRNWTHEVIVCDNNSTDATAAIARAAGVEVVFEPVNQIARARNRGAAAARGEWLLFLDADCVPSPALLAELAQVLAAGRVVGGGAPVVLEAGAPAAGRRLTALWNALSRLTRWAPGGFLFCEAAAFRALGGFSEALYVSEEIDFSRRLKRRARAQRRRVVILRQPILTSARKLQLYSRAELRAFLWQYLWRPGVVAQDRAACPLWYDGRR